MVPGGAVGSISHKRDLAVGMAAVDDGWTLGVDIEAHKQLTRDISRRVLMPVELTELDRLGLAGYERTLAVLMRFSIKEALYKAIDPFVRRYVGFREVSVHPTPSGEVTVHLHLDPAPPRPLEIRARVVTHDAFFLSSARARTL